MNSQALDPRKPTVNVRRELGMALLRLLDQQNWRGAWRLHALFAAARKFVSGTLIAHAPGPILCSTRYGFKMIVYPEVDDGVERSIFFTGTYEAGTLAVLESVLGPDDIFIDVGANVGLMSLYASQIVGTHGKVFSFEPIPPLFGQLRKNIVLNGFTNIHAYEQALGARAERLFIYEHPEINRGSASLVRFGQPNPAFEIAVGSLDDFVTANVSGTIALVKIDVEGWELEVLKGAQQLLGRHDAPALCVEYSHAHPLQGGEPIDLYRFIISVNSYRCFRLERSKARPSRFVAIEQPADLPEHDNLFCFLPNHLKRLRIEPKAGS